MIVPVIGSGRGDDPRRPDLPDGAGYTVVEDHGDTMEVDTDPSARLEAVEERVLPPSDRDERTRYDQITTQAESALVDLRTVAGTSGTLTVAQLSQAVRVLARVAIALTRLALRRHDSTD